MPPTTGNGLELQDASFFFRSLPIPSRNDNRVSPQKWRRCGPLRLHDSRLYERTIPVEIGRSLD